MEINDTRATMQRSRPVRCNGEIENFRGPVDPAIPSRENESDAFDRGMAQPPGRLPPGL